MPPSSPARTPGGGNGRESGPRLRGRSRRPTPDSRQFRLPALFQLLAALALAAAAPALVHAQAVLLQIRPRIGDTLRMRLDQQVEMSGTSRVGSVDSTVTVITVTRVLAHSVVERRDSAGTRMLAVTDSVLVSGAAKDGRLNGTPAPTAVGGLQGHRVQLRVAPDGATEVLAEEGDRLTPELRALFAQMPATLPRGVVTVGDTWVRKMDIPTAGQPGAPSAGRLKATFRLDSLTRGGELAHISMRGQLSRQRAQPDLPDGLQFTMTGFVIGTMAFDRRRGWLTDARTTLTVQSLVTPPAGHAASPMRVRMKVTQWLRAM